MSIFFNTTYYLQNNPDVLAAVFNNVIESAEAHFNEFGFRENRDPNAVFDVDFYLINNPDVLEAGVNPLTHFIEFGAAEGRAPSATFVTAAEFDTAAYAAANPDLAAAGLTTEAQLYAHFAVFGFDEGRPGVQTVDGVAIGANGVVGAPGADAPVIGDTFTLTTTIGESVVGTNANDTFSATVDAAGLGATPAATLNTTDMVDGGLGTDTINIIATSATAPVPAGAVKNVEIVNLIADVTGDGFAAGAANVGSFAGVQQLWQIGASQIATGLTDAVTVGFNNTPAASVVMATGATTANVALVNAGPASNMSFAEATAGTLTTANVSGSVNGAITLDFDTAAGTGVAATKEATLNLGLTTNTTVTVNSATMKTIDASGSTGNLTLNAATAAATETLKGGAGNDTLTGAAASKVIEGGAGADVITAGNVAGEVINAGAQGTGAGFVGDTITLGAAGVAQTVLTEAGHSGLTANTIDKINNFATTEDKLDFNLAAGSATNFLDGGASSGLTDALTNANTAFDGTVQYFASLVGADTFVFVDSDLDGNADMGLQLVGTAAVVAADFIA